MNCPEGRILYHGTRLSSIKGISCQSLRPSTSGRLGQGVYFTGSLQVAEKTSRKRGTGNVAAVFECMAYLGRKKDLGSIRDSKWQNEEYDSAEGIHPLWPGLDTGEFTEFCLKDAKKCNVRMVKVTEECVDDTMSSRSCVINKVQKKWKELKQLDNEPSFDDFRSLSSFGKGNVRRRSARMKKVPKDSATSIVTLRKYVNLLNNSRPISNIPGENSQQLLYQIASRDNAPRHDSFIAQTQSNFSIYINPAQESSNSKILCGCFRSPFFSPIVSKIV